MYTYIGKWDWKGLIRLSYQELHLNPEKVVQPRNNNMCMHISTSLFQVMTLPLLE